MVALVIGNNNYGESSLKNALNDAKAVKKALETQNVKVFFIYDGDIVALKAKFKEYVNYLQKGDAAIVYFAGHGVEYNNALRIMASYESAEEADYKEGSLNMHVLIDRLAT